MFCPLEEINLAFEKCPVRCMYGKEGDCRYAQIKQAQEHSSEDAKSRTAALAPLIPIQEAHRAAKRIQAFIYVDRYTQYAIGKCLDELAPSDIPPLLNEHRFYQWPQSRQGYYTFVERVLEIIQTRVQQPTSEKP